MPTHAGHKHIILVQILETDWASEHAVLSLLGLPEVPSMALPSAPVPGVPGATPSMLGLFKFGGAPG